MKKFVFTYLFALAVSEAIGVIFQPVYGVFCQVAIVTILLGYYAARPKSPYRGVLPVMLIAPLLRILSFIMPIQDAPQIYWFALVGIPLLTAACLAVRFLRLSRVDLGLHLPSRKEQGLIALSGIPLSIAAVAVLRPAPLLEDLGWPSILIGSLILVIFTGFMEEFIFRGLLQSVFSRALGASAGVLVSSGIFAVMYFSSLSISYILFIGLVGLYFSYCSMKTGSIWGVTLAHSLMNVGMVIIWPVLLKATGRF